MKKILVIENFQATLENLLQYLSTNGFYTLGAKNSLTGIKLAQEYFPDLIISEVVMPEINDYEVLKLLRQNPTTATIPLIFLSSKINRSDIRQGMELGADDYLTKPCTKEELLKAVTTCLKKRDNLKILYSTQNQDIVDNIKGEVLDSVVDNIQFSFPSIPQLKKVFEFIENNYHLAITLADVAAAVGYSSTYLTHTVRVKTGQTVQNWIIQRRMVAARSLLLKSNHTVEEIAKAVGYQCIVHFFRQFRQYHGTTPQLWRKSHLHLPQAHSTSKDLLIN